MDYILAIGFISLAILFIFFRRKKQVRLLNEVNNSLLLTALKLKGYYEVRSKTFIGKHKNYQTGFYFQEDPRDALIAYATIGCDIPFMKAKGGLKKITDFSKTYDSFGFLIDSKNGFRKQLSIDFILKSNGQDIFKIFDEMVLVAEREGFQPTN